MGYYNAAPCLNISFKKRLHKSVGDEVIIKPSLRNLFYIFCGHFDEKSWGYHLTRGKVKPSKSEGEEVDEARQFYKSLFSSSDISNFFGEKFNFGLYFTENLQFCKIDNNDVIVTWHVCTLLVCMERGDPWVYQDTK